MMAAAVTETREAMVLVAAATSVAGWHPSLAQFSHAATHVYCFIVSHALAQWTLAHKYTPAAFPSRTLLLRVVGGFK